MNATNLNISHVNVNLKIVNGVYKIDIYLNTSHVNVNPQFPLGISSIIIFKYISC